MKKSLRILAFLPFLWWMSCNKEKTWQPSYRTVIEAVYASATVVPLGEYKVFAMADGIITDKMVVEGDTVRAGQPLFRIESDATNARMAYANDAYQLAADNAEDKSPVLMELRKNIDNAQLKLQQDSINYMRYRKLQENNAVAKADYERILLIYNTSKNDVLAAKERYNRTFNQLKLEAGNARTQLNISRIDGRNYWVNALLPGRVYDVYKQNGEVVRRSEAVALIGHPSRTYVQLLVDETDLGKLRLGQEVYIKLETHGDKVYKAQISKIFPLIDTRNQSIRVDCEWSEEVPNLVAHATVEANIMINKKEKALTIPQNLVFGGDSVFVKDGSNKKAVKIVKGIENAGFVEVLSGLTEQDILVNTSPK